MARFVLVHGAFHGAWCWEPLIAALAGRGHAVTTLDLPGAGDDATPLADVTLDAYAERICDRLADEPEPVVLLPVVVPVLPVLPVPLPVTVLSVPVAPALTPALPPPPPPQAPSPSATTVLQASAPSANRFDPSIQTSCSGWDAHSWAWRSSTAVSRCKE